MLRSSRANRERALTWLCICLALVVSCSADSRQLAVGNDVDDDDEAERGGDGDGDDTCVAVKERARSMRMPVDIIFVVDNSGSMAEEIAAIRQRINDDFVRIVEAEGVDYRVLLVSRYGDVIPDGSGFHNPICIGRPLSGRECDGNDDLSVANGPRFFHYSAQVESTNAWCVLLDSATRSDEFVPHEPGRQGWQPAAPHGWLEMLRSDAFKSIVMVSDDGVDCATVRALEESGGWTWRSSGWTGPGELRDEPVDMFNDELIRHPEFFSEQWESDLPVNEAVERFDVALTALSPAHFGSPEARKYRVHSIVGIEADETLGASDPLVQTRCPTAMTSSVGHQLLSMSTGGLRYSVCRSDSYDEVFRALADDAIRTAQLSCSWEIPAPPSGESFDLERVNVEYTPERGEPRIIPRVGSTSDCQDHDGWYYDDAAAPEKVTVCPKTCASFRADASGHVAIAFGCATVTLL